MAIFRTVRSGGSHSKQTDNRSITEVDGAPVSSSRLVELVTQHDTIRSIFPTSVGLTNQTGVTWTPSNSLI